LSITEEARAVAARIARGQELPGMLGRAGGGRSELVAGNAAPESQEEVRRQAQRGREAYSQGGPLADFGSSGR
jgi:hypothetical protein